MCSTPFDITDYCALLVCHFDRSQMRAQRLSASQIIARDYHRDLQPVDEVLNAFRHHRLLRAVEKGVTLKEYMCSTPFGITDYCAGFSPNSWTEFHRCSTPFGITDYCAALLLISSFREETCSTPFGITDYCAGTGSERSDQWDEMCSTPFGITDYCARII